MYNQLNHFAETLDLLNRKVNHSYDANGRLTSTSRADGTKETRSYNAAGQLTSMTVLNPDGSVMVETSYTYDAAGNVIQEEGGDVQSVLNSVTYDVYGPGLSPELEDVMIQSELSATAAQTEDNASVQQDVYNHSAANGNDTESNHADAANANGNTANDTNQPANDKTNTAEPTTVTEDSYGLYGDLQLTYTADNRLATVNGQAVQYDAEGNMLRGPLNGSMQDYRYDARNRLIQAGGVSYGYDNENNRNSMTVNGVMTKQIINPHAVLSQVLMETDASGTPQAWYVYGQGLISREDGSGNYQTYQYDMRGSTIALTDNKGQVTDTYTYDTYGEQLEQTGANEQPFQYNGSDGVQTDANGLYQMRARYYNPEIKRFVNRDVLTGSIDNGLTMNRYAYVNSVSYIDPFGLSADGATWWQSGFSYGVDSLPGVGTVKGIQEVFTGVDLITGQQLSVADRIAAGGGTLLSFLPGGKVIGKVAVKESIDGGTWLIKQFHKTTTSYAKPSELFINSSGGIMGQKIKPKNLYSELKKSEIGRETLKLIQDKNIEVNLSYMNPIENILGEAFGKTAIAYVRNTQSLNLTSQIIIHEVTHAGLNIKGSRRAEIIAFMRGAKHNNNNNELSISEIKAIIKMVKNNYPELPYR